MAQDVKTQLLSPSVTVTTFPKETCYTYLCHRIVSLWVWQTTSPHLMFDWWIGEDKVEKKDRKKEIRKRRGNKMSFQTRTRGVMPDNEEHSSGNLPLPSSPVAVTAPSWRNHRVGQKNPPIPRMSGGQLYRLVKVRKLLPAPSRTKIFWSKWKPSLFVLPSSLTGSHVGLV